MIFQRTELLIGQENLEKLKNSHVIVFGLGGVGGGAVEALVRSAIGEISLVDFDTVDITNLNRQLIATQYTLGKSKALSMKERALSINPDLKINVFTEKFSRENSDLFFNDTHYDYVIDAIDLITQKLDLIELCYRKKIPIISSMGTGNKIDPSKFEIADISKTSVCPMAKVIRKELKNRNVKKLKVVFSKEIPRKPLNKDGSRQKKHNVGSIAFVPPVVGMILASQVIKDICKL